MMNAECQRPNDECRRLKDECRIFGHFLDWYNLKESRPQLSRQTNYLGGYYLANAIFSTSCDYYSFGM